MVWRFGKIKVTKYKFHIPKKPTKNLNVNVDNIFISKIVEKRKNSKYLIEYLDEFIELYDELILILSKMSGYLKKFKYKGERKKERNN